VEESRQSLHGDQNTEGHGEPHGKDKDEEEDSNKGRALPSKCTFQCHLVQDLGQLGVGERESPQSQIRCGIGDTPKTELDSVNDLVDNDISHVEWLVVSTGPHILKIATHMIILGVLRDSLASSLFYIL
jgi:hypothetical protein